MIARAQQIELGKPWSFDVAEPSLTSARQMLGLLASDVIGLFITVCRQHRLIMERAEATVIP